ncbi:MAG: hypothetical protein K9G46_06980 [Flavobacteriales bacterium]|nr:hypothetical protein [Flavobacteriales bacterium]
MSTHKIDIPHQHFQELEILKVGTVAIDHREARAIHVKDELTLEVFDGFRYTGDKLFCTVNSIIPSQRYGVPHGQTQIGIVVSKSQRSSR